MKAFQQTSKGLPDAPLMESKYNMGNKFARFKTMVVEESIPLSVLGLPTNIEEDSWARARQLVLRSPCCSICGKSDYDFEVNPSGSVEIEWKCCPRCKQGWCCAEHFEEYHQQRHTVELCNKYIMASKIDLFRYNHTINHGDRFFFIPEQPLTEPLESLPKNWDEYMSCRAPMEYSMKAHLPLEFFNSATFLLSQVKV